MKINLLINKHGVFIISLLLLFLLSSCTLKYGVPPQVDQLGSLKVGISTRADVLMTLGEPRGRGATRFSKATSIKHSVNDYYDIWFYEYIESDGIKVNLKFLLVFIDQDLYSGHLWFSSSELMEIEQ